jgi:SAM-dependent methyltransferase
MANASVRIEPPFLPPLLSRVQEGWLLPTRRHPTRADIARRLHAPPHRVRVVTRYWLPPRPEHLYAFAGEMLRWGRDMRPSEWIYWVHPLGDVPLTLDEAEQILGLAAGPQVMEMDALADGSACIVAAGQLRIATVAVGIAWPRSLMLDETALSNALNLVTRSVHTRRALQFVGAPARDDDPASYQKAIDRILSAVDVARARFGVHVESPGDDANALVTYLQSKLPNAGRTIVCQWREDGGDGRYRPVRAFAGAQFDCSLAMTAATCETPYVTQRPYVALDFDLRRPAFVASPGNLVAWPRLPMSDQARGWSPDTIHARLASVLDRETQLGYLAELAGNRAKVAEWHHYHVYNWAPPPTEVVRLVSAHATQAGQLADVVAASGMVIVSADEAVPAAMDLARVAAEADAERAREQQIAAHGYLASGGRHEITADGEALIALLPDRLGDTLEIGFGYALTARRVASRARRYIGIDLGTEQGVKLRECGGSGLVADIHWLPLANQSFDTIIADNVLEHAGSPRVVLDELYRVLKPGGRIYALIPPDGVTSEYQIRTHFWKADEWSIREAAHLAQLAVMSLDFLDYAALGVYGCFPASRGRTCLVVLQRAHDKD